MEPAAFLTRWVEVDLDAIAHNYRQIKARVGDDVAILSVVKADAYGHGAAAVARLLEALGTRMLGVTTVAEGKSLREQGIAAPILVFGPFLPEEADDIAAADLTATVAEREALRHLERAALARNKTIRVHLKIETGLGRTGLWPQEVPEVAEKIRNAPALLLEGVYSHLATAAWRNKKHSLRQFQIFMKVIEDLERAGITGLIRHIANSAAMADLPQMRLDMVRAGTILYGQAPGPGGVEPLELRDTWSLKARVIYVRELPPGHGVGYGRNFVTPRRTRVAVLPVGFADGFRVEPVAKPAGLKELGIGIIKLVLQFFNSRLVNQPVLFDGGAAYIIGKAGMQMTMADITGLPGIEVGSVARLPARRTAVSPLINKVYLGGGDFDDEEKSQGADH